jgi:hypothetical protein
MSRRGENLKKEGEPYRFKPGQSGNPGGKPAGARNRLQGDFLNALADDFAKHGKKAIERMRAESPAAYVKAISGLMPKQIDMRRPLEDLTDEELAGAIEHIRRQFAESAGTGAGKKARRDKAKPVQSVH